MIVDTRRSDPTRVTCEPLSAVLHASFWLHHCALKESVLCPVHDPRIAIGTADHSLNCVRDLLFITDSSRFIHRGIRNRVSVIDPRCSAGRFTPHIGKFNE